MKVAVVGTGYVGLVTGTCLAETGNNVVCIDNNKAKVEAMIGGKVPIYEPHLDVLFERNIREKRLRFTTGLGEGIKDAEIIFLALPTPPGEDGSADLSYVLGVAEELGRLLDSYKVIVDKSTVPVGTAEKVKAAIKENYKGDFDVVSNPEFLREGFAVDDFLKPDRIIIGLESERAERAMLKLYKPYVRQGNPIITMDIRSAELTKYAANSFLAAKITFMNEIANLCELLGADVDRVRKGMGSDSRIGGRFLFPGIGYGGSCFPKDVQALAKSAKDAGYDFKLIDSVMQVNDRQKLTVVPKMESYFKDLKGKKIALWGLAFKPETDDIREAPALYIIDALLKRGCTVRAYDPEAMKNVREKTGAAIEYASNAYDALAGADALVICTEWSEFRNPDFDSMKRAMKGRAIFDGRNVFELSEIEKEGFDYFSVGRKKIVKNG